MSLKAEALREFVESRCGRSGVLSDTEYSLPASKFVNGAFSTALARFYTEIGWVGYRRESLDCDDFAMAACLLMRACHKYSRLATGIAFGEFRYLTSEVGHAVCCYVERGKGGLNLRFYDPQARKAKELTRGEIASCSAIYI